MPSKERTIEGFITKQIHYPAETKSEMTIITENEKEYSFEILPVHSYAKNVWALNKNKKIRIKAVIDDDTNGVIKVNELWSKIELRAY